MILLFFLFYHYFHHFLERIERVFVKTAHCKATDFRTVLIFVLSYFWKKMNHFQLQRLNEVKELNIFFFAQRAIMPERCDAVAPVDQNHAGARHPDQTTSALCAADQQVYYLTSQASLPHRGSLVPSVQRGLCCSAELHHILLKDPPSLVYCLFPSSPLNSMHWCCRGCAKRENTKFNTAWKFPLLRSPQISTSFCSEALEKTLISLYEAISSQK